ncbi:DNA-binding protein WhiA [Dialister invisus]|uniref:DNA-binding protein WhiA n=1 Tax=Dialister invisus TaxID=218538 RepID=UPI0039A20FBD
MSFTEQVKNELARVVRPDKESRSGELLALLRMGGAIVTGAQGKKGVEFSTGNSAVARRVLVCLKKDFNLMPSAMVRQGRKLRKKNVYTLTVRRQRTACGSLGKWDWIRSWISVMRAGWCLPKNGGLIWRALSLAVER